MDTFVYLIRNAETDWNHERLTGRRELGLSTTGTATAERMATHFIGIDLQELLVSPLPRAAETATPLAREQKLEAARDQRLSDWHVGLWEGRTYTDIARDPAYTSMLDGLNEDCAFPQGERLRDVRERMLASVRDTLADNELGSHIGIVSHAGPLRILLASYLSVPVGDSARLQLDPGSVTVLRFSKFDEAPALVTINHTGRLDSLGGAR